MTERVDDLSKSGVLPRAVPKYRCDPVPVSRSVRDERAVTLKAREDQRVSSGADMTPLLGLEGGSVDAAVLKGNPDCDTRDVPIELRVGMPVESGFFAGYEVAADMPNEHWESRESIYRTLKLYRPSNEPGREEAVELYALIKGGSCRNFFGEFAAFIGWKNGIDMAGHAEVLL